ncbi:MAG: hypothetical protein ACOCYG_02860 [Spirochaetota bacterium]
MRKMMLVVAGVVLLTAALWGQTDAQSRSDDIVGEWDTAVEIFPLPFLAFVPENNNDKIEVVRGFNLGIGYTAKHYFDSVQVNQFNGYWAWGTTALLVPHIFAGGEYQTESGFYIGGGGGLFLIPVVYLGLGFYF